ncbi:MAG TPA: deoxyribodipyrimidine photo-lyase [Chitinispirillaceae bacterium]|nr:deoxyribodipyrimidine photo-lyase [Chitinispirillaceae bacterium]
MVQSSRIHALNKKPVRNGSYVLYWMQQSQRAVYNHALEYAVCEANRFNKPLIVYFGLTAEFPEANCRHYVFMLQGLLETKAILYQRGINMVVEHCNPVEGVVLMALDAVLVITDMGYLRIQQQWRFDSASKIVCKMVEIESDVIIPVAIASSKEQFSARTLRPKIQHLLPMYLVPLKSEDIRKDSLGYSQKDILTGKTIDQIVSSLNVESSVQQVHWLSGGISCALEQLTIFINKKMDHFADLRNDPSLDYCSNLSSYLHFGQISPLHIALEVKKYNNPGQNSFLEELIVRRELSMNFIWYNSMYDSFFHLPQWALATLQAHKNDVREYIYDQDQLENAQTHDPYWNAAQQEMVHRGKMHGYMRMYWGKKIIEWTKSPQEAFSTALYLNNKYEIDGRDPNGFTGVAWCFGKHDRAWKERPIFGKVRYMSAAGLKRKFDIDSYVKRCNSYQ